MEYSPDQLEVARILTSPNGDPKQANMASAVMFLSNIYAEVAGQPTGTDYEGNPI